MVCAREPLARKSFRTGTREFEEKWRRYWLSMPPDATADLYAKATVATLTSFFARALSQRQVFESFESFHEAARAGKLKQHSKDWLPPSLLEEALRHVPEYGKWQVRKRSGRFALICTMADGTKLTGTFMVRSGRVKPGSVTVTIK